MKKESLRELKKELETLPPEELIKITLRLAKLKVENKELLAYLLYESEDPMEYAESIKEELVRPFTEEHISVYKFTKAIRKSLRLIAKYLKFTGNRQGETELLLFSVNAFHENFKHSYRTAALSRIMFRCLTKASANISKLHEDLQADYSDSLVELERKTQARMESEPEKKRFRFFKH